MDVETAQPKRGLYWPVVMVLVGALGLRIGAALVLPRDAAAIERLPDQVGYLEIAQNALHGRGFVMHDPRFGQDTYATRTIGYPLLVMACRGDVLAVRLAQALLDASTVLAVYLLARRWLGRGASLLAAGLVAVNPFMIYFSALVLSETLYTTMLAWGLVLLVRRRNFLWGGLVLALAVYVRPSNFLMPLILGLASVFVHHRDQKAGHWVPAPPAKDGFWHMRLPVGSTMLLLTVVVIAPWAYRNWVVMNRWVWLTTNGGITFFDGFNPQATGASDQRFTQLPELRGLSYLGEAERDRAFSVMARQWIGITWNQDRPRLLVLTAVKIGRTWSPVPLSAEYGGRAAYRLIAAAYSIPFYLLVVVGVAFAPLHRPAKLLLLLPAVYLTVSAAMSVGSLRYRIPAEPPMAVLAAAAASMLARWLRPGAWQRADGDRIMQ